MSRPSIYTEELAEKLCERYADSVETLKEICAAEGMPSLRTVFTWRKNNEEFLEKFDAAEERHARCCFDEALSVAKDRTGDTRVVDGKLVNDTARVQRDRLYVDVLLKRCAKLRPHEFGDLQRLEHTVSAPPEDDLEVARRLLFLLEQAKNAIEKQQGRQPLLIEAKPEPPRAQPRAPDIFDGPTGRYVSAEEWHARHPSRTDLWADTQRREYPTVEDDLSQVWHLDPRLKREQRDLSPEPRVVTRR